MMSAPGGKSLESAGRLRNLDRLVSDLPPADAPAVRSPEDERVYSVMEGIKQSLQSEPTPEGHTRLYRYGEVPKDFVPPKTVKMWGEEVPYEEFQRQRAATIGDRDMTPPEAAGRWFTDDPDQLDLYIRDSKHPKAAYHTDVPTDSLGSYNVAQTPFSRSSANPEREFILPAEMANGARRFIGGSPQPSP